MDGYQKPAWQIYLEIYKEPYQHIFHEILIDFDKNKKKFSNNSSISYQLQPHVQSDEIINLQQQIKDLLYQIAKQNCTKKQFNILKLMKEGKNQVQIAKILQIAETTINHTLHGNENRGGIIKKLKKLCLNNQEIQSLFQQINELQIEKI